MPDPTRPGESEPEPFAVDLPPSLRPLAPSGLPTRLRKLAADRAVLRCRLA